MAGGPIYTGGLPFFKGGIRTKLKVVAAVGTAVTLTRAQSNSTFLFSIATNFAYTLPVPVAGLVYDFLWTILETGGQAHAVKTGAGTIFMTGVVQAFSGEDITPSSTLGPKQYSSPVGSSFVQFTCNGTTTGGGIGQRIRVVGINATTWSVTGTVMSPSGTLATPFSV